MARVKAWVKRTCLASSLIFVVGTVGFGVALPYLTSRGLPPSQAGEAALGYLLFIPFLLLALVSGVLLLILTIWDGARQLF
jgi:hypothetical protein